MKLKELSVSSQLKTMNWMELKDASKMLKREKVEAWSAMADASELIGLILTKCSVFRLFCATT